MSNQCRVRVTVIIFLNQHNCVINYCHIYKYPLVISLGIHNKYGPNLCAFIMLLWQDHFNK